MSKFKLNDKIVCVSNGAKAIIVAVDTSPMTSHVEYTILWDHLQNKTFTYFEHEIINEWMLDSSSFHKFISSLDYLSVNENIYVSQPNGCNHNMMNYVGFKESYKYCTKCDHKEYRND